MGTLLTAHIHHFHVGQMKNGLKCECTLSDARLTAQERDTTRNQSSTQHTVQLTIVHINARLIMSRNIAQTYRPCSPIAVIATKHRGSTSMPHAHASVAGSLGARIIGYTNLLERIPLSTTRALAYPFRRLLTTVAANISYLVFCHILMSIKIKDKGTLFFHFRQIFATLSHQKDTFCKADITLPASLIKKILKRTPKFATFSYFSYLCLQFQQSRLQMSKTPKRQHPRQLAQSLKHKSCSSLSWRTINRQNERDRLQQRTFYS